MKRILGLDLGTNSIGWALVQQNFENEQGQILGMGSRECRTELYQTGWKCSLYGEWRRTCNGDHGYHQTFRC